jgi:hypothetical protein
MLVLGANGKFGQAEIQLATAARASVSGAERTPMPYRGRPTGALTALGAADATLRSACPAYAGGHSADIVYNTVGSRLAG